MILLTVSQAERYFCPYRESNCVPHECMSWKYVDHEGYCYIMSDDEIQPKVKPEPETVLLEINGYRITIRKPELSLRIVKNDYIRIYSDEYQEAIIDRQEWEARESCSDTQKTM